MKKGTAEQVVTILKGVSGELFRTVQVLREGCDDEEFVERRKSVGRVMADIFDGILHPIIAEYPELKSQVMSDASPPDGTRGGATPPLK